MQNEQHDLDLFFLGPKSEQREFLSEILQLVMNDHVFWRRNYWPKDPPAIPYSKVHGEQARHFRERFFTELFRLISELKLDVPVFSPRYMAHMISETNLPSLISYFATLLYNPNNVSSEASPVTIRYELQVGKQFAELFGFPPDDAFGHLTSGGTVANYESLWYAMAGRTLPVAIALASDAPPRGPDALWELMNVPLADVQLRLNRFLAPDPEARFAALREHMIGYKGLMGFARAAEEAFDAPWVEPVLVAPRTAHYSWSRALSVIGIGKHNVCRVEVDAAFRTVPEALEDVLRTCMAERRPVWQIVTVLGATEFGSVDPVDRLVDVRNRLAGEGMYAPIHADGAYGGYFATMFREGVGGPDVDAPAAPADEAVRAAFVGLGGAESVTVDPHKAGYTPYGAGSIVIKHGFLKDLVAETAPYCLDREDTTEASSPQPQLGKFILEGSKPGAAAASVWFSHRLIPLNMDGYGRQLATLCRVTADVHARIGEIGAAAAVGSDVDAPQLVSLYPPQLNLLCILAVPPGVQRLSDVNALNEQLAARFGVKDVMSIQSYDYLVSRTTVATDMPAVAACPSLAGLDLDAENVSVLRLVFMNRWFEGLNEHGESYRENFLAVLQSEAARLWLSR
ncbi:MAG: pyridoxal-dependent decarboxylase [Rhodothermales bacterium]